MRSDLSADRRARPTGWRPRWLAWRNRLLGDPRFQKWAQAFPLTRPVARKRAGQLFDLLAGFTYSQTLFAVVESGLLEHLAAEPQDEARLANATDLSEDAMQRLLRAAQAIDLSQEITPGWWTLGEQGAALHANPGAQAMIRHHRLLYADLADPLALLRDDRATPTGLSEFWRYAANGAASDESPDATIPYSELMRASQAMVCEQVLAAYDFSKHRALLDIGGGHGAFLEGVGQKYGQIQLGLFDLPGVIAGASERLATANLANRITFHPGSFFADSLPHGYDCFSLVRILHDHDDEAALQILESARAAMQPGHTLLIAEPMAATRGAERMGDAYFGLYLWAMRSGRPRRASEIGEMLNAAGFARWREIRTNLPLITRLIVARA